MRDFLRFLTLLLAMTLVGCGAAIPTIKPYKMDIQQGNVVTSEMLLKLRPGMTKSQVQFIMGTPLLVDSFHTNRWDYFYQLRKQGEVVTQRRVILDFEKDLLVRVRGDVVPKGTTAEDVTKLLETEADKKEQPKELSEVPTKETDAPDEPIVKTIDAPDVEPVDSAPESTLDKQAPAEASENTESNAPASVLAVPIPVQPTQPSDSAPKSDMQAEEAVPPNESTDARPEQLAPVSEEEEQTSTSTSVPAVDAAKKPSSINNDSDEKLIFRLDRQLDDSRVNREEKATPKESSQDSVVKEIKESPEDAPLNEEEPGAFERLLEKIGF